MLVPLGRCFWTTWCNSCLERKRRASIGDKSVGTSSISTHFLVIQPHFTPPLSPPPIIHDFPAPYQCCSLFGEVSQSNGTSLDGEKGGGVFLQNVVKFSNLVIISDWENRDHGLIRSTNFSTVTTPELYHALCPFRRLMGSFYIRNLLVSLLKIAGKFLRNRNSFSLFIAKQNSWVIRGFIING